MAQSSAIASPTLASPELDDEVAGINDLPEEILEQILGQLRNLSPGWLDRNRRTDSFRALSLVCRRFHRLATPHLYSELAFDIGGLHISASIYYDDWDANRLPLLHRTLQEAPSLRCHCQSVVVRVNDFGDEDPPVEGVLTVHQITLDVVRWLPDAKAFSVLETTGGMNRHLPLLPVVVRFMPALERLCLDRRCRLPSKPVPSFVSRLRNLKELELHGHWRGRLHRNAVLSQIQVSNVVSSLGSSISVLFVPLLSWVPAGAIRLSTNHHQAAAGTGTFTSLILQDVENFDHLSNHLPVALKWPTKLENFSFHGRRRCPGNLIRGSSYPVAMTLAPLIALHKDTLRFLTIKPICTHQGRSTYDLRDFTSLEELTVSCWYEGRRMDWQPGDASKLLAPSLRRLRWDFQSCDAEDHLPSILGRDSSLRRIEIFYPLADSYAHPPAAATEVCNYPWDGFDRLADEVRPAGIEVWYLKPTVSRSAFLEKVCRESREFHER